MSTNQLYRHFDAKGNLLYVGISLNAINRLLQHKEHADWFENIANVTIDKFESRELAIKAEILAIKTEKPIYNISHNKPAKNKQIVKPLLPKKTILPTNGYWQSLPDFETTKAKFTGVSYFVESFA